MPTLTVMSSEEHASKSVQKVFTFYSSWVRLDFTNVLSRSDIVVAHYKLTNILAHCIVTQLNTIVAIYYNIVA